jgi:LytTr DNA-binding domain
MDSNSSALAAPASTIAGAASRNVNSQNRFPSPRRSDICLTETSAAANPTSRDNQTCRIEWLEAQGDYVLLHAGKESYLIRETLQSLESRLNPRKFVRIHRSSIINLDFLNEFEPIASGDYRVSLRNGIQLTLSRSFRHKLHPATFPRHPACQIGS